jgi:hypothetical protein
MNKIVKILDMILYLNLIVNLIRKMNYFNNKICIFCEFKIRDIKYKLFYISPNEHAKYEYAEYEYAKYEYAKYEYAEYNE